MIVGKSTVIVQRWYILNTIHYYDYIDLSILHKVQCSKHDFRRVLNNFFLYNSAWRHLLACFKLATPTLKSLSRELKISQRFLANA